jgi:hypothetical protein
MNVAMIQLILAGVEIAAQKLPALIAAAKQSGELSGEQLALVEQRMTAAFKSDAWKTDAQLAAGPQA